MSFVPWIKMETTTPDKPEVVQMAARLRVRDHDLIVGKLVRLWSWADMNSVDGQKVKVTRAFIDRHVSMPGFAAALEEAEWIHGPDGAIDFANFERHNGDSAKRRAMEARKKQNQRKGGPKGGTNVPETSGQTGGLELELESLKEKDAADGGGVKPLAPDPLLERVRKLRTEYSSPLLDQREREPFKAARPLMETFAESDWEIIGQYLNAKLPAGIEAYQPDRRLLFWQAVAEIHGKALAWHEKQSGQRSAVKVNPWPVEFEAWAAVQYSSLSLSSAWAMGSVRHEFRTWLADGKGAAA